MNIDEHIKATEHLLACQKAFKEGKKILFQGFWLDDKPSWRADPLNYSIAPEPKLRPWERGEWPVGSVIRKKDGTSAKVMVRAPVGGDAKEILENYQWCWPHEQFDEKAWKPCGVAE